MAFKMMRSSLKLCIILLLFGQTTLATHLEASESKVSSCHKRTQEPSTTANYQFEPKVLQFSPSKLPLLFTTSIRQLDQLTSSKASKSNTNYHHEDEIEILSALARGPSPNSLQASGHPGSKVEASTVITDDPYPYTLEQSGTSSLKQLIPMTSSDDSSEPVPELSHLSNHGPPPRADYIKPRNIVEHSSATIHRQIVPTISNYSDNKVRFLIPKAQNDQTLFHHRSSSIVSLENSLLSPSHMNTQKSNTPNITHGYVSYRLLEPIIKNVRIAAREATEPAPSNLKAVIDPMERTYNSPYDNILKEKSEYYATSPQTDYATIKNNPGQCALLLERLVDGMGQRMGSLAYASDSNSVLMRVRRNRAETRIRSGGGGDGDVTSDNLPLEASIKRSLSDSGKVPDIEKKNNEHQVPTRSNDLKIDSDHYTPIDDRWESSRIGKVARARNISKRSDHHHVADPISRVDSKSTNAYLASGSGSGSLNRIGTQMFNQICITFDDVDQAVDQARRDMDFQLPNDIDDREPSDATLNSIGELNQITSEILADRFELTADEILNGLPLIDIKRTNMWDVCPMIARQIECMPNNRYRSISGHCNNLNYPTWGASNTPFVRYMPAAYADGISQPRISVVESSELPPPRLVSSMVHQDYDQPSGDLSVLFMSWGQLIDHDMALATPPRASSGHNLKCCPDNNHPLCLPIKVPADDPIYAPYDIRCLEFKRSLASVRPNCVLGPRSQMNAITGAIDANFIYGTNIDQTSQLRSLRAGQLRMWNYFSEDGLKPLLPPQEQDPDIDCINRPENLFCFTSGDVRVNEQIQLTTLHVMHVRDHNRMARILQSLNPHWNDERVYQETRHIQAAIIQHILLNEYLPILIGPELIVQYNLTEADNYWHGYDSTVNIGISHSFSTAAFRQGHTFIQGVVRRYNNRHELVGTHQLRTLFKQPWELFKPRAVDEFVLGMVNTPTQSFDPFLASDISGHLFEQPGAGIGLDLPSINIQRAREQGVPGYNAFREWCGLPRAYSFVDLVPYISNYTAYQYSLLYRHVDDIDLFTGGLSEQRLSGAQVGPTFACIIARQFSNLRRGDRFWFENPMMQSSFMLEQLMEIKKMTLSRILCSNSDDIQTIQRFAFQLPHPIFNDRVPCTMIPDMDLSYWQEPLPVGK